ncbi:putative nucleotidyltransferase, ribonuclease H [Tanacetum coccineum]
MITACCGKLSLTSNAALRTQITNDSEWCWTFRVVVWWMYAIPKGFMSGSKGLLRLKRLAFRSAATPAEAEDWITQYGEVISSFGLCWGDAYARYLYLGLLFVDLLQPAGLSEFWGVTWSGSLDWLVLFGATAGDALRQARHFKTRVLSIRVVRIGVHDSKRQDFSEVRIRGLLVRKGNDCQGFLQVKGGLLRNLPLHLFVYMWKAYPGVCYKATGRMFYLRALLIIKVKDLFPRDRAGPDFRLRIVSAHVEVEGFLKEQLKEMVGEWFINQCFTLGQKKWTAHYGSINRFRWFFRIYSDASKKGLGCVLMQHGKVITYASRQLKPYEVNYPTHDLELVAVEDERLDVELCDEVLVAIGKASMRIESTHATDHKKLKGTTSVFLMIDFARRASWFVTALEIPMWKWDEISMDFVTGLPLSEKRHDAIWEVVDRITKLLIYLPFLPIRKNYGISKLAEIFRQEIVRLHGTPTAIVSDRDPKFTSRFWKGLQKAWGTRLKFSTAFHPQTDGQSERTIQTLEDMLRACALEWTGSWDEYLCLVEFAYNNSWHASIKAAPFELLYGRKCRAPICWDEVGERLIEGPELIEITNEKVAVAKEKLKEARSRQKSYADKHRRDLEFQVGDRVFLKVSPFRGVKRFGIKGKLSPRFIGPFEILERIGEVSYRLALPPQLSHVHDVFHVSLLRGYHYHPLHVASYPFDQIQPDMSLSEEPESILDRQERVMRNKVIPFVKILWKNHPEREATWETEESMRASYPHFFV